MLDAASELRAAAEELTRCVRQSEAPQVSTALSALEDAANDVGKAWSGSWFGYHANTYYRGLSVPPPGAHFSSEWGADDAVGMGTRGDWVEHDPDQVRDAILKAAGGADLGPAREAAAHAGSVFEDAEARVISILELEKADRKDAFLMKLLEDAKNVRILTASQVIRHMHPSGTLMSRDSLAMSQGLWTAPHLSVLAEVIALRSASGACRSLALICNKAASHLERVERRTIRSERVGTNIFIGHGRSFLWRDLKDFLQDRLGLPWDEFNRVPVAGVTNISRLSEMLDAAALAFIILTAEDEAVDGSSRARMNVIHEVGLFQGRLGFTRAIVLLEDGCEEFSNIQGLGQIRFPNGNIRAVFEEVRQVLEREGVLDSGNPGDV